MRGPSFAAGVSLIQAFVDAASRHADEPAVITEDGSVSFRRLASRADEIAAGVRAFGMAPRDRIAVDLPRSADSIAATLAILLGDAVVVPLDRAAPHAQRISVAVDRGVRCIIGDGRFGDRIGDAPPSVDVTSLASPPGGRSSVPRDPEAITHLLETSGSTGIPAAVPIRGSSVLRLVDPNPCVPIAPGDRMLLASPPSFDASLLEIFLPLLNGAAIVPMPPGPFSIQELGAVVRRFGVTHGWLTAGLMAACVDEDPSIFAAMRVLMTGGDVVSPRHVGQIIGAFPDLRVFNGYGPTENTIFTTLHEIKSVDVAPSGAGVPIGRAVAGTDLAVVDGAGELVPCGERGELVAFGAGVSPGYINGSRAADSRFDTFAFDPRRGYRTGDQVVMRETGVLEFAGRLDDQVKIAGVRVDPAEVEERLRGVDRVRDAAVVVIRGGDGAEPSLHAAITVDGGSGGVSDVDVTAIASELRTSGRAALVPASIAVHDSIPLTSRSKPDRARILAAIELGHDLGHHEELGSGASMGPAIVWTGCRLAALWNPLGDSIEIVVHLDGTERRMSMRADEIPRTVATADEAIAAIGLDWITRESVRGVTIPFGDGSDAVIRVSEDAEVRLRLPRDASEAVCRYRADVARRLLADPSLTRFECVEEHARIQAGFESGPQQPIAGDLWEHIAAGLGRSADRIVLIGGDQRLSGSEVLSRTASLAASIVDVVGAPGARVVFVDHRSIDSVVNALAIVRAGATAVPLDPDMSVERMRDVCQRTQCVAILGDGADAIEGLVRVGAGEPSESSADPPHPVAPPDTGAVILFTSGSTGRPRGAAISRRGILNQCHAWSELVPIDACDVVAHRIRLTWDVGWLELFWSLGAGAGCLVVDRSTAPDLPRLADEISRESVTVLFALPSAMPALARVMASRTDARVRVTIAAGERLDATVVREWVDAVGGAVFNLYGPTEAAISVTAWPCDPRVDRVPIGRPLRNVGVSIVDPSGRPVPIGVRGELVIHGVQVSHGYLEPCDAAEQARFARSMDGTWSFRTGDACSWDEFGRIRFHGRLDRQAKINGVRIELAAIESAASEADVGTVAVVVVGSGVDARLAVAVDAGDVCADGDELAISRAIRRAIDRRVPDLPVAPDVMLVDAMPRLPNGKVDRAAVTSIASERLRSTSVAPEALDVDDAVLVAWGAVLGAQPESDTTTVAEAGGSSLALMRIISRLESAFGIAIELRRVILTPTPAALSAAVRSGRLASMPSGPDDGPRARDDDRLVSLVTLRPGRVHALLFPGLGLGAGPFREIAAELAPHIGTTVCVLDGAWLESGETPAVEDFVDAALDQLERRGTRSLVVGGVSGGGILAATCVERAKARGFDVGRAVVIDGSPRLRVLPSRTVFSKILFRLRGSVRLAIGRSSLPPTEISLSELPGSGRARILNQRLVHVLASAGDRAHQIDATVFHRIMGNAETWPRSWRQVIRGSVVGVRIGGPHAELSRPATVRSVVAELRSIAASLESPPV